MSPELLVKQEVLNLHNRLRDLTYSPVIWEFRYAPEAPNPYLPYDHLFRPIAIPRTQSGDAASKTIIATSTKVAAQAAREHFAGLGFVTAGRKVTDLASGNNNLTICPNGAAARILEPAISTVFLVNLVKKNREHIVWLMEGIVEQKSVRHDPRHVFVIFGESEVEMVQEMKYWLYERGEVWTGDLTPAPPHLCVQVY